MTNSTKWKPDPMYLEQIIRTLKNEVNNDEELLNAPLITGHNKLYSVNQIIEQITKGTKFGQKIYNSCKEYIDKNAELDNITTTEEDDIKNLPSVSYKQLYRVMEANTK